MSLSPEEVSLLEKIYKIGRQIETNFDNPVHKSKEISLFKNLILELKNHPNPHIQKLASIESHLTENMTLRHFLNFLIPIERMLNKSIKDNDFLITETDHTNKSIQRFPISIVLEDIRSAFNVGSIFRSSDGLGVSHLYLAGYTPTPENAQVQKTSLGSHEKVPWSYHPDCIALIKSLKNTGHSLVALETSPKAATVFNSVSLPNSVFILGNERFGLSTEALQCCDKLIQLPMYGFKNSYNVSVAASLIIYDWILKWNSRSNL